MENNSFKTIGPWRLNRTHNADCLLALKQMPANSIDIAITSPPYWGQRAGDTIGNESDPRDYIHNLTRILKDVMRCLKPTGTLWLNLGDAYNTPLNWTSKDHIYSTLGKEKKGLLETNQAYVKNRAKRKAFVDNSVGWLKYGNLLGIPYRIVLSLCDEGFLFRGEILWVKSRPLPEGICRRPHRRHESIFVFAKDEKHLFRRKPPVSSVWKLIQTPGKTEHSSTFPLSLPLECINAAEIKAGSVVLDPFMGSGTTGRAAKICGCNFLGFEINPKICEIANEAITQDCLNTFSKQ